MIIRTLTGRHYAAARAMLGMTQEELAQIAGVAKATIQTLESFGRNEVRATDVTLKLVQRAFDTRGLFLTLHGDRWLMGMR